MAERTGDSIAGKNATSFADSFAESLAELVAALSPKGRQEHMQKGLSEVLPKDLPRQSVITPWQSMIFHMPGASPAHTAPCKFEWQA